MRTYKCYNVRTNKATSTYRLVDKHTAERAGMSSTTTTNAGRTIGLAFGGLVALVAAIASYVHMHELAAKHAVHGQEWLSWIVPLSVDGLLVVASIDLMQARRRNEDASWISIMSVITGLVVSLAAN